MTPLEEAHEKQMKKNVKQTTPFDNAQEEIDFNENDFPNIDENENENIPSINEDTNQNEETEKQTQSSVSDNQSGMTKLEKMRAKFAASKRKSAEKNKGVAIYDEETEAKLTEYFGGLLPEVTEHQAYLTKVVPFEMNADTPDNFSDLVGKRVTLIFAMKNPNNGKIQDGYKINLSYLKITKETRPEKDPANWEFEEPENEHEKMNFISHLVFGKYGVKKFEDLVKLNQIITPQKPLPFTAFSYMMVTKFQDSTRTKINYQLTNHGASYIVADKPNQELVQFCAENNGSLPAKVFAIKNNENFRRYEVYLTAKDRNGKEHVYCQKFTYARTKNDEGRKIGYKRANTLPPDYSKLVEVEQTITDKLRIMKEDWGEINKFNAVEVNISAYKTPLTDSNGNAVYAIEILS